VLPVAAFVVFRRRSLCGTSVTPRSSLRARRPLGVLLGLWTCQPQPQPARRTLHTGADLLTDKQKPRLHALFAVDGHVEVEVSWGIYQRMIAAYRKPDRKKGRDLMSKPITSLSQGAPAALKRGSALGFRNLINYIARSLLETGGFRRGLHPGS